jgi:hypothetical protein
MHIHVTKKEERAVAPTFFQEGQDALAASMPDAWHIQAHAGNAVVAFRVDVSEQDGRAVL